MCDNLTQLAFHNLDLLKNLHCDDNLTSNRKRLSILKDNDEYVKVDSINDIEYCIYFTFTTIFQLRGFDYLRKKDLCNNLNISIDKIYENHKLNELIEGKTMLNSQCSIGSVDDVLQKLETGVLKIDGDPVITENGDGTVTVMMIVKPR